MMRRLRPRPIDEGFSLIETVVAPSRLGDAA